MTIKKLLSVLSLLVLAGCAAAPGHRTARPAAAAIALGSTGLRYEYQLEVVYTDGATPFLHLAEARDP